MQIAVAVKSEEWVESIHPRYEVETPCWAHLNKEKKLNKL